MHLPSPSRLARASFHRDGHRAPCASAFQVSAAVILVGLANASGIGKPQVSVGGSYPGVWIQGGVNKFETILQQSVSDSFLVPRMLSLTQAWRGRCGQTRMFLPNPFCGFLAHSLSFKCC